jgi:hypothetical protein
MFQLRKFRIIYITFSLVAIFLTSCSTQQKFSAPEIDPPEDLIPGYVPAGFTLVSGFQLDGEIHLEEFSANGESGRFGMMSIGNLFYQNKSPAGNAIKGVYYQGGDQLILITKSSFPQGSLELWKESFNASLPGQCECDCINNIRLDFSNLPKRSFELLSDETVNDTQVAVLKGPMGFLTLFMRGEELTAVESGISLEENLKIVSSLLSK